MKRLLALLIILAACSKSTSLAPLDTQLIAGSQRDVVFIVMRQDGGMPSADRALADDACKNLARVLLDAKVDGGVVCP